MDKGRQGEQRKCHMEELQPLDLAIWRVEKVDFFHNHKIQIQDHGFVALVHMSSTNQRTMKTENI
jgi:hypothetical protein